MKDTIKTIIAAVIFLIGVVLYSVSWGCDLEFRRFILEDRIERLEEKQSKDQMFSFELLEAIFELKMLELDIEHDEG